MSNAEAKTKMIVGLGNPGAKYDGTRHNIGFDILNHLAQHLVAPAPRAKFEGQWTSVSVDDTSLLLVWPLTFMNHSGRCVKAIAQFYKIDIHHDLIVVCDDLSLPLGKLRIRAKGSAGGQKGLNHILQCLGTQEVARLRVGIDPPPPRWDAADYVLGKFRADEKDIVQEMVRAAATALIDWCRHDLSYCMNRVN